MELILTFKMKAMKGLFESFFVCFPLPTLRGILNIPIFFLGKSNVTIIYCLFFIHLCKGYYHNYVSYHRIHRYILLSWGIPYKRVYQGGRKLTG